MTYASEVFGGNLHESVKHETWKLSSSSSPSPKVPALTSTSPSSIVKNSLKPDNSV